MTGRVSLGPNCVSGLDARFLSRQLRSRLEASEEEPSFSSRPCGPGSSIWGCMRVSDLCQKGPALPRGVIRVPTMAPPRANNLLATH